MLEKFFTKIFGSRNDRILRRMNKIVQIINQIEYRIKKLSNEELTHKTSEFRARIMQNEESINNILPEAFAVVREASIRIFGMRHFDVQLLGGIILHNKCIAEMRTGEGKTLTATLPAYLNSLSGKGVHIVTVNDYLAQRDANNNRPLFEFLGLTVGVNLPSLSLKEKRIAYSSDITYGTNNEYGFDYLRDNMSFKKEDQVQRTLHYALIDEVDSILIDEARTPLVISGPAENSSNLYHQINSFVPNFIRQDKEDSDNFSGKGHFSVDEKSKQVHLTERGLELIENLMIQNRMIEKSESLYSSTNISLMRHFVEALRAHVLFFANVDYIVKKGEIIIIDEHTGRALPGRRWSDGLHQAIEAKENVIIQNENQTLASITFQNYFRLYEKLSGMTGTADTEAFEFKDIYKLDTVIIPTNCPMIRKDFPDLVYITEKDKINAIINDIKTCTKRGQPVLVGTVSIEKSEIISRELKNIGIQHKVLNAKFHAKEAEIIAQAGKLNAVTISTNMAGRGTDIMLGGNLQTEISELKTSDKKNISNIVLNWEKHHNDVLLSGGLHIIGAERHESRRIDNQLRGRSGRQGDPGSSRFYLSMEDSLMRIFASERIIGIMRKLGMKSGEAIEHNLVTKAIANAQKKVENYNFNIRKQLLEYDDVANDQRKIIYFQRNSLLELKDISKKIQDIYKDVFETIFIEHIPPLSIEELWNISGLELNLKEYFNLKLSITKILKSEKISNIEILKKYIFTKIIEEYSRREIVIGHEVMRNIEKHIMLHTLDSLWKDHLSAMDYLRQGIHLRGYAQKDPKQEYKRESFKMFSEILELLKKEVVIILSKIQVTDIANRDSEDFLDFLKTNIQHNDKSLIYTKKINNSEEQKLPKVGRNDLCPCGSYKKFKHCHGKI